MERQRRAGSRLVGDQQRSERNMDMCAFKDKLELRCSGSLKSNQQCGAKISKLPLTLSPLLPWMVERDVASTGQLTGIGLEATAAGCPVLVGSLSASKPGELPELPSLQHVDDELPYSFVLPVAPPVIHKKYSHPALERAAACQGWVCQHSASHLAIISPTGDVIHRANLARRTTAIVRQEIRELEMLMQGVVMQGSTCTMVRFQDEINQIQEIAKAMLAGMAGTAGTDDRLPAAETDYTGLRQFCREYESALAALRARREECAKELQDLELLLPLSAPLLDGSAQAVQDVPERLRRQSTAATASAKQHTSNGS